MKHPQTSTQSFQEHHSARWTVRVVGLLAAGLLYLTGSLLAAPGQPQAGSSLQTQSSTPPSTPIQAIPAHRQADHVAVITIDTEITRVTAYSFLRRLEMAERGGADAVVIELDTPGGQVGAVLEITDAIRRSSITNSVAWVHSNAYSGGAIIAIACKEIITAQPARMGDALPIILTPGGLKALPVAERQKVTAPLLAEVVSSARMRGWDEFIVQGFVALDVELWWVRDSRTGKTRAINEAEYRLLFAGDPPRTSPILASAPDKRNPVKGHSSSKPAQNTRSNDDAQRASDGSDASGLSNLPRETGAYQPASPALDKLAVDSVDIGLSSTRTPISLADRGQYELIGYLSSGDGPLILNANEMAMLGFASNLNADSSLDPVQNDSDLAIYFGAKHVRRLAPSWSESLVLFMGNTIVRGVLIVVFLMALFLEMSHPGIGLPGGVAMIALLALLAPPALMGLANWWEIGAIFVGVFLIVIEIFILPGFGIPGLAGLMLLFGGLVGTFVGDTSGGLFPDSPQGQSDLMYGMVTILLSTTTAIVGMYFLAKHFGSIPLLGGLILTQVTGQESEDDESMLSAIAAPVHERPVVGQIGKALTPLRPAGRAQFGDHVLDVVSDLGYIESEQTVRVLKANEFRIVVEKVDPASHA